LKFYGYLAGGIIERTIWFILVVGACSEGFGATPDSPDDATLKLLLTRPFWKATFHSLASVVVSSSDWRL
jgi:hypothetical protein